MALSIGKLLMFPIYALTRIGVDPSAGVQYQVAHDPRAFIPLCGYRVAGLEDVRVEDVSVVRADQAATARITARPKPFPGVPAGPECAGRIRFEYYRHGGFDRGDQPSTTAYDVRILERSSAIPDAVPTADRHPALQWNPHSPAPILYKHAWPIRGGLLEGVSAVEDGMLANDYLVDLPAGETASLQFSELRKFWEPDQRPRVIVRMGDQTLVDAMVQSRGDQFYNFKSGGGGPCRIRITLKATRPRSAEPRAQLLYSLSVFDAPRSQ